MDEETTANGTETTTEVAIQCNNQGPLCDALAEWTGNQALAESFSWILGTPVKIAIIVVAALILNRIMRKLIRKSMLKLGKATSEHGEVVVSERSVERAEERASTIGSLLRSASTAVIWGVAFVMILEAMGVGIIAIIASAGILGLAIGFGAQSVVEDLLRGLFMLAEDQFSVGDRIDVGEVNGVVERVTLRTAVIRAPDGTVWHIPNSEIDRVANENQISSRASVEVGVAYGVDTQEAMAVIQRAATDAANEDDWSELVASPPEVQGVQELGDDSVQIRVVVWVNAGERRKFERHLRLRLKEALDSAEIEMPNRQLDVFLRGQTEAA
ncbi:MAG: mechanosensitive ion channel family protein [Thermoleophilia bacterium]|nr:mechanosensitive ion channel family protein [Thermoleophilia bacterium]MDH3725873.1 mechanosensitive ion channel family protein [Thermoleophilia bacterium]